MKKFFKELVTDHVEMAKEIAKAPFKEVAQTVIFMGCLFVGFYYSILIFG